MIKLDEGSHLHRAGQEPKQARALIELGWCPVHWQDMPRRHRHELTHVDPDGWRTCPRGERYRLDEGGYAVQLTI